MEKKTGGCPVCGPLAARMDGSVGELRRWYGQLLCAFAALERQGVMELFAGDCPLADAAAVLDAEQHYTVCHYMRCRKCGALYFLGACIRGVPVFRRVMDLHKENLNVRLWGRCGTWYSQNKG